MQGMQTRPHGRGQPMVHHALRAAADCLEPVVVRSERTGARCEGIVEYFDAATGKLSIAPVHASALLEGPLQVFAGEAGWALTVHEHERRDASRLSAQVDPTHFRTLPPRKQRLSAPAGRPLSIQASCFGPHELVPVLDLGAEFVAADSSIGVPPGTRVERCDLVGERGVYRSGAASIVDCVPWFDLHGNGSFRLRVRFEETRSEADAHDLVTTTKEIQRVLGLAAMARVQVRTTIGRGLLEVCADGLRIHDEGRRQAHLIGDRLELAFELFDNRYTCRVRVRDTNDAYIDVSLPAILRWHARRTETRVAADGIVLSFRHPLVAARVQSTALDISPSGVALAPLADAPLWDGLPLEGLRLESVDGSFESIPLGAASVCSVFTGRIGVRLSQPATDNIALHTLMNQLAHPTLPIQQRLAFDPVYDLYRRAKLLAPFMEADVEAHRAEIENNWLRVHEGDSVCHTLLNEEDGNVVAAATALQAWDGTWIAQHLATQKGPRRNPTGSIFRAFVQSIQQRADFRYLAFFTSEKNERIIGMHGLFRANTGTHDTMGRTHFECWRVPEDFDGGDTDAPAIPLSAGQQRLVERVARRELGTHCAASLGLVGGEVGIPNVGEHFHALGLARSRRALAFDMSSPGALLALDETCSRGVNLTGMMDALWLMPIRDANAVELERYRGFFANHRGRMIITTASLGTERFERLGLEHLTGAEYYAINRAGIRRYMRFLTDMFGAMNLRRASEHPRPLVSSTSITQPGPRHAAH